MTRAVAVGELGQASRDIGAPSRRLRLFLSDAASRRARPATTRLFEAVVWFDAPGAKPRLRPAMRVMKLAPLLLGGLLMESTPALAVQHEGHGGAVETEPAPPSDGPAPVAATVQEVSDADPMLMASLGGGWSAMGMAQAFPIWTRVSSTGGDSSLDGSGFYLTQPAVMINVESPGSRFVLRTTLNFEAETQHGGEYTPGGWGEGYLDKRHPHSFLHELMLSWNLWDAPAGAVSISVGKGFAPYGTDDPMSRPVVKYPTNHHLSQILERWTFNGVYLHRTGLSLEAGLFSGAEPKGPSDLSNIEQFGDSWSARVAQRFGGAGTQAPWEVSASYGRVAEEHHETRNVTGLANAAIRHDGRYAFGDVYGLVELSRSDPREGDGYWALLGETSLDLGRQRAYYRAELSTRPEYTRHGPPGSDGFFRYDHDDHPVGASQWQIHTLGYEVEGRARKLSIRPFGEVQYQRVSHERGAFDDVTTFGGDRFWTLSGGFKLFLGGASARMGSYGTLDPMTEMLRGSSEMEMDHTMEH